MTIVEKLFNATCATLLAKIKKDKKTDIVKLNIAEI